MTRAIVLLLVANANCKRCDEASSSVSSPSREPSEAPTQTIADVPSVQEKDASARVEIIDIDGYADYTCALGAKGAVYCWGSLEPSPCEGSACNVDWSQRGPERIPGLPPIKQISVGLSRTVALADSGKIYAWGLDVAPHYRENEALEPRLEVQTSEHSEVRASDQAPQARTTQIPLDTRLQTTGSILFDGQTLCLLDADGRTSCGSLGSERKERLRAIGGWDAPSAMPARLVAASDWFGRACHALANGTLRCADGTSAQLPAIQEMAYSTELWAGISNNHELVVWESKDGAMVYEADSEVVAVDVGIIRACFLTKKGVIHCGIPDPDQDRIQELQPVEGVEHAVDLALGGNHLCWLEQDGRVICWGNNAYGQCGVVSEESNLPAPVEVRFPPEGA